MKMKIIAFGIGFMMVALSSTVWAKSQLKEFYEEGRFSQKTIISTLQQFQGKHVTVTLKSGQELTGHLSSQTDFTHTIHLKKLVGKNYFDAVVSVPEIATVVFRAREPIPAKKKKK